MHMRPSMCMKPNEAVSCHSNFNIYATYIIMYSMCLKNIVFTHIKVDKKKNRTRSDTERKDYDAVR